jgi:hypothetical protein
MKTKHIIIGLIIVLVVLFFVQKKEHAGSTATPKLSNEAIQNIAKVYADTTGTATFNNIKASDTATVNGMATFTSVTNLKGGTNPNNSETHFPFWDGKNYIRGPTQIDGATSINGATTMGTTTMGTTTINGDLYYTKLKGKGEEQRAGTHGLDGNVGGQYTLKCPEGTVMIGIYGWASSVINKIGPICK